MLSYDAPASLNGQSHLNGQRPKSPAGLTAGIPAAVASKTQPIIPDVPTISTDTGHIDGSLNTTYHHIWLVTGPAGCGKTTVAEHLATALKVPYIEGDSVSLNRLPLHPNKPHLPLACQGENGKDFESPQLWHVT